MYTGLHQYHPWFKLISGNIVQDKEKWMKVDKEMEEKESNLQEPNPGGQNHLDSAILLSDLLIKLEKENDKEEKKSESGAKLEKRDVVDRWIKVEKPGLDEENPGKNGGDPDYGDSAELLSDLLIKLNKDNADEKKTKKKSGNKKELKPPSSMLTAILGVSILVLWSPLPAIDNLNFAIPLLQNSQNPAKSSNITYCHLKEGKKSLIVDFCSTQR